MISIVSFFDSVAQYAADHYVGLNPMPEFVIHVNESQREIMDLICPQYDRNERIRVLMDPFVKKVNGTASGTIAKPSDYYRALSITATFNNSVIPVYQAKENELIEQDWIPQRKADFAKRIAYYKQAGPVITVIPSTSVPYEMYYAVRPTDISLDFDYADIGNGEQGLVPTDVVDLEWNPDAFGLLLNWVLRKYGLIEREQFLLEIANYGIDADLIQRD